MKVRIIVDGKVIAPEDVHKLTIKNASIDRIVNSIVDGSANKVA